MERVLQSYGLCSISCLLLFLQRRRETPRKHVISSGCTSTRLRMLWGRSQREPQSLSKTPLRLCSHASIQRASSQGITSANNNAFRLPAEREFFCSLLTCFSLLSTTCPFRLFWTSATSTNVALSHPRVGPNSTYQHNVLVNTMPQLHPFRLTESSGHHAKHEISMAFPVSRFSPQLWSLHCLFRFIPLPAKGSASCRFMVQA